MEVREWVDLETFCGEARNQTGIKRFTFVRNDDEDSRWGEAIIVEYVDSYKGGKHVRYEGAPESVYEELRNAAEADDDSYWINAYTDLLRNDDDKKRVVQGESNVQE